MGAQQQGISGDRWAVIPRTLVFIRHGDALLLMQRANHKRVLPGRYNGIGGHIERDEDVLAGALREIREETGLAPDQLRDLRLRGITHIDAGQSAGIMLFVFTAEALTRDVIGESGAASEGTLHWVPLADIGGLPLVDDVPLLLPRLFGPLANASPFAEPFSARMSFDESDQMQLAFHDSATP